MRKARFLDDYDKKVIKSIEEFGHHVQAVFPTANSPKEEMQFCYTVGRTEQHRPELYIVGPMALETMHGILNYACSVDDQESLEDGQERDDILQSPVRIVACDPVRSQMFMATRLYGGISALQLVYPDKDGHFPGDEGYTYPEYYQPIHRKE